MHPDDREQFRAERAGHRTRLAADADVRTLDTQLIARSDQLGYSYVWDWMGLPVIQMPTDVMAAQEVIWTHRPQVVVETGVARGGSLVLLASLMAMTGDPGRVIGVDIDVRAHNREAVEAHPMASYISLVEGSSVAEQTVSRVRELIGDATRVMLVLDSDHTHRHVLAELRAYADIVSPGQCVIVADTVVEALPVQEHRPRPWGPGNNPLTAVRAFLQERSDFTPYDEINDKLLMSSSRGGYLRRSG